MNEETGKFKKGSQRHQTENSTRREFIRKVSITGGCALTAGVWGYLAYSDSPIRHPQEKIYSLKDFRIQKELPFRGLVSVRGGDADKMVEAALSPFGGMGQFIQRGDKVVVKPNVAWDRTPEQAANSSPEVVEAVVRQCLKAGAGEVIVADVSCNDPYRCFSRSGIEKAALSAGAKIIFPREDFFLPTDLKGDVLKVWPVFKPFLEADKVINIPVVKHHSLSGCTIAMKSWYGILGGRRNQLHQDIHASIADLAGAVRPTLTIIDATRILVKNGPTGGSASDVKILNTLVAGLDEVALDTYAAGFLGLAAEKIPFLKLAEARGIGSTDIGSIEIKSISV